MKELKIFFKIVWYVLNNEFVFSKTIKRGDDDYDYFEFDIYACEHKGLELRVIDRYTPEVTLIKYTTGTPMHYEFGQFESEFIANMISGQRRRVEDLAKKKEKQELLNKIDI